VAVLDPKGFFLILSSLKSRASQDDAQAVKSAVQATYEELKADPQLVPLGFAYSFVD
jgi:hypothetical protein